MEAEGRVIEMLNAGNGYNNAIQLGHETYRDGIIGVNNKQETREAVIGHTAMAAKMQSDGKTFDTSGPLGEELALFEYAQKTGDWGVFDAYAGTAYDWSADY